MKCVMKLLLMCDLSIGDKMSSVLSVKLMPHFNFKNAYVISLGLPIGESLVMKNPLNEHSAA